jgi:hypothetical protein
VVDSSYAKLFVPVVSWYVLSVEVEHLPHATLQTRDEQSMDIMQRTLQYDDRARAIQKHTPQINGSVLWKVILGK